MYFWSFKELLGDVMSFEIIFVIGFGYIGLLIVVVFVLCKKKVIGVDVNVYVVEIINCGVIYIVELDLDKVVKIVVEGGYLWVVIKLLVVDVFFIVVLILFKGDYELDMVYVELVVKFIVLVLKKGDLVIFEFIFLVGVIE